MDIPISLATFGILFVSHYLWFLFDIKLKMYRTKVFMEFPVRKGTEHFGQGRIAQKTFRLTRSNALKGDKNREYE